MTIEKMIEDIFFEDISRINTLCIVSDSEISESKKEEEGAPIYDLMIPKEPKSSIIGILKKNKERLEEILGTNKYFIKLRTFHYYFSLVLFKDYPYKDGVKSFLSIETREIEVNEDKLVFELCIVVIGSRFQSVPFVEIQEYLTGKLYDFNQQSRYVYVRSFKFALKDDAFKFKGDPDLVYQDVTMATITDLDFG